MSLQKDLYDSNNILIGNYWQNVSGTYASANTFTFTGVLNDTYKYKDSIFYCFSANSGAGVCTTNIGTNAQKLYYTAHGHANQDIFMFISGTLPTVSGITLQLNTKYFIVSKGANDFQMSLTPGGTALTFTADGVSLVIAFMKTGFCTALSLASTTVTTTVYVDYALASGDQMFSLSNERKILDYEFLIQTGINGCLTDATNPQGLWKGDLRNNNYLLGTKPNVQTAAAGSGASCCYNIYDGATALYSSAPDLATNNTLDYQIPTIKYVAATDTLSMRNTSNGGATNYASKLQVKLLLIPIDRFMQN